MHVNKKYLELWNTKLPSLEEFTALSWNLRLKILALLGHLAPSSHNTQPWKFYCDEKTQTISVVLDRHLVLLESDPTGRQAVISIGCAIENIVRAGEVCGLESTIKYFRVTGEQVTPLLDEVADDALVTLAEISFNKGRVNDHQADILKVMQKRMTMRAEFDPDKEIPPSILRQLTLDASKFGVTLHVVEDKTTKLTLSEFQAQADGYALNSPLFARELGEWLLPNETENMLGMPGNTFGLDDIQAKRIHEGLVGKIPLEPEDMLRFALGGKVGFEKSPAVLFITAPHDDISGWIATGRAMERIFLTLEGSNISYAVHAGIVEVRLVKRIFASTLGIADSLTTVFRIGYLKDEQVKMERPHSPRQPMEAILLNEKPC